MTSSEFEPSRWCITAGTEYDARAAEIRLKMDDDVKRVMHLWEDQTRAALIALGWTPPRAENSITPPNAETDITKPAPVVTDDMFIDLKALADSINGDCYLGQEWERKTVNALLAALGAGHE